MMHSDPEVFAMLAMGESDVSDGDRRHIDSCPDCARELSSLTRVAELARSGSTGAALADPRPEVWHRISAELGLAPQISPPSLPAVFTPDEHRSVPADVANSRRRLTVRRRRVTLAVAAAALVVAGGSVALTVGLQQRGEVLAVARLDALPEWAGSNGVASVEQQPDGERDVTVELSGARGSDAASGYREVWLLKPDLSGLVSLGVLTGDNGRFVIPSGVDLDEYSIVDISREGVDGDPAHSGDSIVRGALES